MKFSLWMENRRVKDAIMGVLGADPEEEDDVMDRKTTYFSSEIRDGLKGLGVVKAANDDRGRYSSIVRKIDDGITIAELIKMVGN